jgi:hypothetical protein
MSAATGGRTAGGSRTVGGGQAAGGDSESPGWTAYFQALHSALIDELIERHPEPKPCLGLPRRGQGFFDPPIGAGKPEIWTRLSDVAGSGALLALAYDASIEAYLNPPGVAPLWTAWVARAQREFEIRRYPALAAEAEKRVRPDSAPGTFVWIPFELQQGTLFMGFGTLPA